MFTDFVWREPIFFGITHVQGAYMELNTIRCNYKSPNKPRGYTRSIYDSYITCV